jgi:peptidoglycan/LPS O-acetylase OafA/YrhL
MLMDAAPRPPGAAPRIRDIERLRGVAIVAVVFYHLAVSTRLFEALGLSPPSRPFWLGVDLFFVISGFVVARSFLGKPSLWQFYLRRVFRLWPVMASLIAVAALGLVLPGAVPDNWPTIRRQILPIFLGYFTFHAGKKSHSFQVLWSLSVEEQFYLVVPLLLLVLLWWLRGRTRAIAWVFLALYSVLALLLRCGLTLCRHLGHPLEAATPSLLRYLVSYRFDFLVLGVFLALYPGVGARLARLARLAQRTLLYLGLFGPFVLLFLLGPPVLPLQVETLTVGYAFGLLLAGLCFCLVVGLASLDHELLATPSWLDRVLLYLGARSYSIYALHLCVYVICYNPWYFRAITLLSRNVLVCEALHAVLTLLTLLPLVEVVHRLLEKPGIELGRRVIAWLAGRRRQRPGAEAEENRLAA